MPTPDNSTEDWGAELLQGARREQRQHHAEVEQHIANPEKAQKLDDFCIKLMQRGKCSEVINWIETKSHTLGELDWVRSRRLVKSLSSLGCLKIYACEIFSGDHGENTGHLVIELPRAELKRKKILKKVHGLAREQGYAGPFDDGQRYVYVKLD